MKFIYCLNEDVKEQLIQQGFKFIKEVSLNNSKAFLFANNPNVKLNFSNNQIMFSNKLTF